MSKTPITADDPDFGHLVPDHETPVYMLEGQDRVKVGAVVDPSGQTPTILKSLRLPREMVDAIAARNHPEGFTGVVRDALTAYLAPASKDDVLHALDVLQHAAERLRAA